jgi:hypothetical protein
MQRSGKGYVNSANYQAQDSLRKRVADDLVKLFQHRSVFSFLQRKSQSTYVTVFTEPDGSLWSGEVGKLWFEVLGGAGDNPVVQKNALEALELFVNLSNLGEPNVGSLVSKLWKAATAHPVGKKWREILLRRQQGLTAGGLDRSSLVVPSWLTS